MRGGIFQLPNLASLAFAPGPQPYSPGNSTFQYAGSGADYPIPWPGLVPTLNTLLSAPGQPRNRADTAVVDRFGTIPHNYLFIAGFVGKSKG